MKFKRELKINHEQFIIVEKDKKIFLVTKYDNCFTKGFTETRVELVPKKDVDLNDLSNNLTKLLSKMSDNTLITNLSNSNFVISKLDNLTNQWNNVENVIKTEIEKDRKYQENKEFIESDMFKELKSISKFKDMDNLDFLDLLKEMDKVSSKYNSKGGKH